MGRTTMQINLRMKPELREHLQKQADSAGTTLTKEINDRLEKSLAEEELRNLIYGNNQDLIGILAVVACAMRQAGPSAAYRRTFSLEAATEWIDNTLGYDQAVKAAIVVLEAFRPPGEQYPPGFPEGAAQVISQIGESFAWTSLSEAATGRSLGGPHDHPDREVNSYDEKRAEMLHRAVGRLAKRLLIVAEESRLRPQSAPKGKTRDKK